MKVLVVGDIHWSTYSSIVRSRGVHFSTRLEYLIKSLSWVEQISKEYGCEEEIFLGDTFDKPDLSSEEITALSEVEWNKSARLRHFIVGNHESGVSNLTYNSTQILHKMGVIEDAPYLYSLDEKTEFLFLPYITEDDRKQSIIEYMQGRQSSKKLIVFSHNDIKNFQMGPFLSKTGFDIDDIERNCDLYINGHLHNGGWVSPRKILNLGILCGQNFSEDAFKYEHHVAVLDTDTLELTFIENPYALNFYKVNIEDEKNINQLAFLKPNAVVSVKCIDSLKDKLLDKLVVYPPLVYKTIYTRDIESASSSGDVAELNNKDHLEQFKEYILETLGTSDVVQEELQEVCK